MKLRLKHLRRYMLMAFFVMMLSSLLWMADRLTAIDLPHQEDPIRFYSTQQQDDLRQVLVHAIQKAKNEIVLIIYALNDEQIIRALREKAMEGVKIKIICDAKASARADKKLGKQIQIIKRQSPGLMHLKILVIDSIQTWIGSANFTTDSLRIHGNLLMGFHHEKLADAILQKAHQMPPFELPPAVPNAEFQIGTQRMELWFLPDNPEGVGAVKKAIGTAKKSLRVAMFTWTRYDLAREIIAAQKKRITASVVVDYLSGKGASANAVDLMHRAGVPVRLSDSKGLLHYKFLYIDQCTLVHGSANWTLAAFTKNDDCFIILYDLNEPQKRFMESLWGTISAESRSCK